jgi:hypothetical protein
MGAPKFITAEEGNRFLAIAEMVDAGKKHREIAEAFGWRVSQVQSAIYYATRYREGLAVLATDPTNIEALYDTGKLPCGRVLSWPLRDYGVTRLDQLADEWSRAELARFRHIGKMALDQIVTVMGTLGLKLAPDREKPKVREKVVEDPPKRARSQLSDVWADRDFVVEQCRRVRSTVTLAHELLKAGEEDDDTYLLIVAFLQGTPRMLNPVSDAIAKLRDEEKVRRQIEKALGQIKELRAEVARTIAATAPASNNVIQFPAALRH